MVFKRFLLCKILKTKRSHVNKSVKNLVLYFIDKDLHILANHHNSCSFFLNIKFWIGFDNFFRLDNDRISKEQIKKLVS